ncbi:MAG: hypothetical protein Q8934_13490 [Bacillota bacterium]|nr:hypothetical protein [Bacillota bacterium]
MIKKITIFFLGLLLLLPIKPLSGLAATNSPVSIDLNYLVVSPAEDGSTNVSVMVDYTNSSASEYKGDGKGEGVIKVDLPEGATNFKLLDNKIATKKVDNGFVTTDPIEPNQNVGLQYSYSVPKGKGIVLKLNYPVQIMQVLVPEGMGSVEVKGADSSNQGLFNFDNKNYWEYAVDGIQVNQPFTIDYSKDKQPPSTASNANANTKTSSDSGGTSSVTKTAPAFHNPEHIRLWEESPLHSFNPHIFLIVLLAIIIAGISYYAYFRRKAKLEEQRISSDKEENAFKLLMAKQKAILEKILELEESHDNGEIAEEYYTKKLGAYKEHLVQVKLGLRKFVE